MKLTENDIGKKVLFEGEEVEIVGWWSLATKHLTAQWVFRKSNGECDYAPGSSFSDLASLEERRDKAIAIKAMEEPEEPSMVDQIAQILIPWCMNFDKESNSRYAAQQILDTIREGAEERIAQTGVNLPPIVIKDVLSAVLGDDPE